MVEIEHRQINLYCLSRKFIVLLVDIRSVSFSWVQHTINIVIMEPCQKERMFASISPEPIIYVTTTLALLPLALGKGLPLVHLCYLFWTSCIVRGFIVTNANEPRET